jgi:hypothetical protein
LEPSIGTRCIEPMSCEYGDAVRPECRSGYWCSEESGWLWAKQPDCEQPPVGYCPTTQPAATSCDIATSGVVPCEYGNTICVCPCGFPHVDNKCGPEVWRCDDPPTTDGCPAIAPNYGSPCSTQGLECSYGSVCDWGYSLLCFRGIWVTGTFGGEACSK